MEWMDERMPLTETIEYHASKYYAPKNFNFWYYFGILASVVLVLQLVTGIWLTMSYVPSGAGAFESVEYIMRDVEYGWLLRYLHSTGASAFFVVVYLHMFRGLAYGSYQKPRELLWLLGMFIFIALMAEGFFGYLLPWGNMSYWAAQVIVSLAGAIPVVGPDLMEWVRGDFLISEITLNRFFALHVIALPAGAGDFSVPAHCSVAPCRLEQSRWYRDQETQRRGRHPARWDRVPSVLHSARHSRDRDIPLHLLRHRFLRTRHGGLLP